MFFKPSIFTEYLSSLDCQSKIDSLNIDENEKKLEKVQSSIYDLERKLKEIKEVDIGPSVTDIIGAASDVCNSFTIKTALDVIGFTIDVYDYTTKMHAESKISGLINDYKNYERELSRALSQAYEYRDDINECFSNAEDGVCIIERIKYEIDNTANHIDDLEYEKKNIEDEIRERHNIDSFFNPWSLESRKDDIERQISDCIRKINNLEDDAKRANDSIRDFQNKYHSVFYPYI